MLTRHRPEVSNENRTTVSVTGVKGCAEHRYKEWIGLINDMEGNLSKYYGREKDYLPVATEVRNTKLHAVLYRNL